MIIIDVCQYDIFSVLIQFKYLIRTKKCLNIFEGQREKRCFNIDNYKFSEYGIKRKRKI